MLNEITKLKRKHKTWTLLDCAMVLLNRTDRRTKEFEELSEIIGNLHAKKYVLREHSLKIKQNIPSAPKT